MARDVKRLSTGWLFHRGDVAAGENPSLDDDAWQEVTVPHDWSIGGRFRQFRDENFWRMQNIDHRMGYLPQGIGWYRLHVHVPASWAGKRVTIRFDGVYRESTVWIDGRKLGFRPYGYATFSHDLTPHVKPGKTHVLAVRVNNTGCSTRWYAGSGIYRKVELEATHPVHVAEWGTRWTTPVAGKDRAVVRVETTVANDSGKDAAGVEVQVAIVDRGQVIARAATPVVAPAGETTVVQDLAIDSPRLWSPATPSLYEIRTAIVAGGEVIDEDVTPLGIRWFRFDPGLGFFLNDEPLKFKGVCLHHDNGPLGAREFARAAERKLAILRGMGCNAIRTSHNPPSRELLDACDRTGFMVMDEAFDEWVVPKSPEGYTKWFYEPVGEGDPTCWYERDVVDFVRRDRNHPCVILWSCGNEVSEQNRSHGDLGVRVLKDLLAVFHREDPTRPVTQGCNQIVDANATGFADLLDVVGYNYHGDKVLKSLPGGGFRCIYDEEHEKYPMRVMLGSENCSAFNTRGVYEYPVPMLGHRHGKMRPNIQMASYDVTSEHPLMILDSRPYVSGYFTWTGFDYIGEPSPYNWPAVSSYFGVIDLCGFPKDSYFLHKRMWVPEKMVHLVPSAWNFRDGEAIEVWAYSNCETVELLLNGRSLGEKRMDEYDDTVHQSWFVTYEPGRLEGIGRDGGAVVATFSVETAGFPHRLDLAADRLESTAGIEDIIFLEITARDVRGLVQPLAENLVTLSVSGPARIAGVANGNPISHEPFDDAQVHLFMGKALAVLQPTGKPGTVTVAVNAPMLHPGTVTIALVP